MAVNSVPNTEIIVKKQKLEQVNNEISTNDKAIAQNQTDVSTNETSVNTNNTDQQATSASITDVKEQITTLQSNKSGVQAEMNSVRDALNGASKDDANYAQLNQQMDSLQMSLSDLETMEKNLNNQKTNHENKLSNQQKEGKALAQNREKLNKEGKTLNAKKADLEKQKKTAEADVKQAEKAQKEAEEKKNTQSQIKPQQIVMDSESTAEADKKQAGKLLNNFGNCAMEGAQEIVEDILDNKSAVKQVANVTGANLKTASNIVKGVGKVASNAGSLIDVGTAIYDYSQGTISGGKALMKTGFAAADVAVNAVPYVGSAISFIGTENIANSGYDELQAQTNEMQQAIKNKDAMTMTKIAIDTATGTTTKKILVGAVLKKVDSLGGVMGIENTYESYRNGTLLKVVAGQAKKGVQSAYNGVLEFFGISEPEKNVRKTKKGSKKITRTPITAETKAKAKKALTPNMQKTMTNIENIAKKGSFGYFNY